MPKIMLRGALLCMPEDVELVLGALPDHIRKTRAEPGCIAFSVSQSDEDPCRFDVAEIFANRAAFEAHQTRTRASDWFAQTGHIKREYQITEG